jgi:hypothetical protein
VGQIYFFIEALFKTQICTGELRFYAPKMVQRRPTKARSRSTFWASKIETLTLISDSAIFF